MYCTRLGENTGRKKSPKNCHLGTVAHLCLVVSSQLRPESTIGKNFVKEQYLLHVTSQYDELQPTDFGLHGRFDLNISVNENHTHNLPANYTIRQDGLKTYHLAFRTSGSLISGAVWCLK